MNKQQKKSLYESIMKSVAKQLKTSLNEAATSVEDTEFDEFLANTDNDAPFYIMSIESAKRLKNVMTSRCKTYEIAGKVIVVPILDDTMFFDALNTKLLQLGDRHMFTLSTIGDDMDDVKGNILNYIDAM